MPMFGGGGVPCTLCKKSVYPAELVKTSTGNIYHKACLRCTECNVQLTSTRAQEDAATGRCYCKAHYDAMVRSAGGAHKALDKDATVLVEKKKKKEDLEEVEALGVGAAVWVDVTRSEAAGTALARAQPSAECYARAVVASLDDAKGTVTVTADGASATVPRKLCTAAASAGSVRDNLMLLSLNEACLLENLRSRFAEGLCYTDTGELELLALNPYEQLACASPSVMAACRDGTYDEPHVWKLAERVYQALTDYKTGAQSVVVSGESGAGKTETNKLVIQYLRWRASSEGGGAGGGAGGGGRAADISKALSSSNTLLEGLGNARTTNNYNSSRFGKYLELAFTRGGALCGGEFKTFLLEKSRVARQGPAERNFHGFYLLCSAPAALRSQLGVRDAKAHAYTRTHVAPGGDLSDAKNFADFDAALKATPDGMLSSSLYGVLGAILHLGDITFDEPGLAEPSVKGHRDSVHAVECLGDEARASLRQAASLLDFPEAELTEKLTQRWISPGPGEEICIPLKPHEASQVRDAVSKAIYQRLFLCQVHVLNKDLKPAALAQPAATPAPANGAAKPAGAPPGASLLRRMSSMGAMEKIVGLLDVFGFESLGENGLEQLCINFANEKLHHLFLSHVFHGIPPTKLKQLLGDDASRIDNHKCLELVGEPPNGILHLLDFQCKAPKASENTFCLAVNQKHAASRFLQTPTLSKTCTADESSGFLVRHFAGDVLYTAGHFLELNNDSMNDSRWLSDGVGNQLVRRLFTDPTLQPAAPAKKGFISVGAKFSTDLDELISTLEATDISFVRCMKPNLVMKPRVFEPQTVRDRVRAAGTLSSLKYMRKLMPASLPVATIARLRSHASRLPAALRTVSDPTEFALALMETLGVPSDQVAIDKASGHLRVATALVPFLAAMEEKGEAADAEAAEAASRMAAEVTARSDGQRRKDEAAAVAQVAKRLSFDLSLNTISQAVKLRRGATHEKRLGESSAPPGPAPESPASQVAGGEEPALKAPVLDHAADKPWLGKRVVMSGLKGRADLNGKQGEVLSYDVPKGRYTVRVDEGIGNVAFKPSNLALTDAAPVSATERFILKTQKSLADLGRNLGQGLGLKPDKLSDKPAQPAQPKTPPAAVAAAAPKRKPWERPAAEPAPAPAPKPTPAPKPSWSKPKGPTAGAGPPPLPASCKPSASSKPTSTGETAAASSGDRIRVFWPEEKSGTTGGEWYTGSVLEKRDSSGRTMHKILYESVHDEGSPAGGEPHRVRRRSTELWQHLDQEEWEHDGPRVSRQSTSGGSIAEEASWISGVGTAVKGAFTGLFRGGVEAEEAAADGAAAEEAAAEGGRAAGRRSSAAPAFMRSASSDGDVFSAASALDEDEDLLRKVARLEDENAMLKAEVKRLSGMLSQEQQGRNRSILVDKEHSAEI